MQDLGASAFDLAFRGRRVVRDRALVMAIVNRTPDSFYDRGATFEEDAAKTAVERAVAEGADVIDIGGVTASPGAEVDTDEEIRRVLPTVEWVKATYPDVLISVDTWRHEVADAVCRAGADIINDAWGAADPEILDVAATYSAGYICTHSPRTPRSVPVRSDYEDVVRDVVTSTVRLAELAESRGVPRAGILIDGTGYGKNTTDHLTLVARTEEIVAAGWPVLMALSNKTFVRESLDLDVADRDELLTGTLAATALAARAGAAMFRVHQTLQTRRTLEMVACINGTRTPARAQEWIS
ncbi:dihydropteroate synthase [Saccharopolyspora kobensis]|uniref:Dihydropteroate synthase n=2 Tax=Saccharopolyspora kobensis TaxID=146035 RepID=A0A1H6E062_9PSEU|nr:dihydropteroate synthase [Saccharopolyspora kobensis]SFD91815.1 dihydropteroate synthase [Saccharopolyspora kobensis]